LAIELESEFFLLDGGVSPCLLEFPVTVEEPEKREHHPEDHQRVFKLGRQLNQIPLLELEIYSLFSLDEVIKLT
jgi:hypothetical protein